MPKPLRVAKLEPLLASLQAIRKCHRVRPPSSLRFRSIRSSTSLRHRSIITSICNPKCTAITTITSTSTRHRRLRITTITTLISSIYRRLIRCSTRCRRPDRRSRRSLLNRLPSRCIRAPASLVTNTLLLHPRLRTRRLRLSTEIRLLPRTAEP